MSDRMDVRRQCQRGWNVSRKPIQLVHLRNEGSYKCCEGNGDPRRRREVEYKGGCRQVDHGVGRYRDRRPWLAARQIRLGQLGDSER